MTSTCTICGKSITHKPSKHPKFCSRECKAKSQCGKQEYKVQFDNEEIKRLYLEEKLSTTDIAKTFGTYRKIIRQRLLDMNVELRSKGESKSIFLKKHPDKNINNIPGVKEKQIQAQIAINSDTAYSELRKEKRRQGIKNMTP
jgi:hypothetical protein